MATGRSKVDTNSESELKDRIADIVKHIDNPYSHFGLGVEHEGYGKGNAPDYIMEAVLAWHHQQLEARQLEAYKKGHIDGQLSK
jgi:hypothetical protein